MISLLFENPTKLRFALQRRLGIADLRCYKDTIRMSAATRLCEMYSRETAAKWLVRDLILVIPAPPAHDVPSLPPAAP